MNTVLGYSSSSEEDQEEDQKPVQLQQDIVPDKEGRVLGGAVKNTFNDSIRLPETNIQLKTKAKITDFIPTSVRQKKQKKDGKGLAVAPTSTNTETKTADLDLNIGDIFDHQTVQRSRMTVPIVPQSQMNYKQDESPAPDSDIELEDSAISRRIETSTKRSIDESQIIDFNLNDFYAKNNAMIDSGQLNFEEHERRFKKVKYYNTTGTNQLSDLIRFSTQNKDKLDSMHEGSKHMRPHDRGKR